MKSLKLLIPTICIALAFSACSSSKTEAPDQSPQPQTDMTTTIQFYKDSVTQLENELAALKEETYIMSTTYELKIRELEEHIESIKAQSGTDPTPDESSPNQNISINNQKPHFEYALTEAGAVIKKYTGSMETVEVPSSIDGRPVTKILEYAFSETNVKSVVLSDTITELDWFAFYKCPFLEKIYIPTSVNSIGYGAFDYCSKSLTIYGEQNSYAHKYAASFGISFKNQ